MVFIMIYMLIMLKVDFIGFFDLLFFFYYIFLSFMVNLLILFMIIYIS